MSDFDSDPLNRISRLDHLTLQEQEEYRRYIGCSVLLSITVFAISSYSYLSELSGAGFNFKAVIPWHYTGAALYLIGELADISSTLLVQLAARVKRGSGVEMNRNYSMNPGAGELVGDIGSLVFGLVKSGLIPPLGIAMGTASFFAAASNLKQLRKL